MFSRIVIAAAIAGLVAGLVWTAAQQAWTVPLILEAEAYENAAAGDEQSQEHEDMAWSPGDGLERTLSTALGNVVLAAGLGLLLIACYALRGGIGWRQGLAWGLAGFVSFNLAPAIGLPPELPGGQAAALDARQIWWLATVVLTGGGLAMIAFLPRWAWKAAGVVLIVAPHLIGAPHPEIAGGLAPAELQQRFVVASLATNAMAWIVLGGLTALFHGWMDRRPGAGLTTAESV